MEWKSKNGRVFFSRRILFHSCSEYEFLSSDVLKKVSGKVGTKSTTFLFSDLTSQEIAPHHGIIFRKLLGRGEDHEMVLP
jgi:hypothetical protein